MESNEKQILALSQNLVKQGLVSSSLDAKRMARAMIEGSTVQTKRNTEIVQSGNYVSTFTSPSERLEAENKHLREQLLVAQARVAEFEQQNQKLMQKIAALESQSVAPQSTVAAPVQTVAQTVPVVAAFTFDLASLTKEKEQIQATEANLSAEELIEKSEDEEFIASNQSPRVEFQF